VDKSSVSVSGLSSGAFFAVQFHVAYSSTITGAGIIAGGPFFCAQDNLSIALTSCTKDPVLISVTELVAITHNTAATFTIDSPDNLKNDKVFVFAGTLDSVVHSGVGRKLVEYYGHFVQEGNIDSVFSIPSEHGFPTDDYGNPCDVHQSPFINNCSYSAAYNLLNHIYGDIKYANSSSAVADNLLEFDQAEFFIDVPKLVSMDSVGYVYVPTACKDKSTKCRLHLSFHGCLQGRMYVGSMYALKTELSGLAEVNDIIILYPQTVNSTLNPKGCWDWWGYTGVDYASKLGYQMDGVEMMRNRVAGTEYCHHNSKQEWL
jgi:hypothetical protein